MLKICRFEQIVNKSIIFASNYGYKEDSKQHMEGGFVAHSGWRHPLLDVSRIRLQTGRRCSASQDELDLDAAVVPFWHLCPGVQRMEMETVAGTIR